MTLYKAHFDDTILGSLPVSCMVVEDPTIVKEEGARIRIGNVWSLFYDEHYFWLL